MRNNRSRGAAYVSVTWVFFFAVLMVAAVIFSAVQINQVSVLEQQITEKNTLNDKAKKEKDATEKELVELSKIVGYDDPERANSHSSTLAISKALEDLRGGQMPDMGTEVKTLQVALSRSIESYSRKKNEADEKESQRKRSDGELVEARATMEKISGEKQTMIDDLRKQFNDANDRATAEKNNLEQRIASLQGENKSLDAKFRDYQGQAEKKESDQRKHIALLNARIQEFSKKMAFTKEPMRPDGSILSMSEKLDLGYLDLGTHNRVRRGMRFDVLSPNVNSPERKKGVVEITEVHPEFSEFRVVETTDAYIPLTTGDLVANPLFDPVAERNAVLAGRFSGRFSRTQLTALLQELGIHVQSTVDITTDYLILGSEEIVNGEAVPLPQNADYKKAETLGVVLLPMKEVESFFNF